VRAATVPYNNIAARHLGAPRSLYDNALESISVVLTEIFVRPLRVAALITRLILKCYVCGQSGYEFALFHDLL